MTTGEILEILGRAAKIGDKDVADLARVLSALLDEFIRIVETCDKDAAMVGIVS